MRPPLLLFLVTLCSRSCSRANPGGAPKQIVLGLGADQTLFGVGVCFDSTVGENMRDRNVAARKMAGDQNKPVAIGRIALGAHQRHAMSLAFLKQPRDAFTERGSPAILA
jgi:hypothetical protein